MRFACQDISVAGKQKGLENGQRSGLFFEIIRLLAETGEEDKPEWLVCENVKNLLSINRGFDFARVLYELGKMGYDSEFQLFNTCNSYIVGDTVIEGIPQNRERVYIISHLRNRGGREVLPVPRADCQDTPQLQQIGGVNTETRANAQRYRVYDKEGISPTLGACMGEGGNTQPMVIGGIGEQNYGSQFRQGNRIYDSNAVSPSLCTNRGNASGGSVLINEPRAIITPSRIEKRQQGRRIKEDGEPMFTLTAQDIHGVVLNQVDNCTRTIRAGYGRASVTNFCPNSQEKYPCVLKKERTEYGKSIRKAYENGEIEEKRANMTQYTPRTDGISNTITTVQKDNYVQIDTSRE